MPRPLSIAAVCGRPGLRRWRRHLARTTVVGKPDHVGGDHVERVDRNDLHAGGQVHCLGDSDSDTQSGEAAGPNADGNQIAVRRANIGLLKEMLDLGHQRLCVPLARRPERPFGEAPAVTAEGNSSCTSRRLDSQCQHSQSLSRWRFNEGGSTSRWIASGTDCL